MSRRLEDLLPEVERRARLALKECEDNGIDTVVSCTYRSPAEQDALYAQGRTKPGRIVTRAKANQSFHQFRVALDVYPLFNGKLADASNPLWDRMGAIFKRHGFDWAWEWRRFKEKPHFQYTGGHSLSYFQAGGKL